jgi:transposase-like protein
MSDIEIITDGGRRRRWPAAETLRIVEETPEDGARISIVARRNGVAPNLLVSLAPSDAGGGSRGPCPKMTASPAIAPSG